MLTNPLCAALLLLSPVVALAQTSPRLYVGASAVLMRFYPFESYSSSHIGPAATIGVQLSPRWAVETGAQLTWTRQSNYNTYVNNSGSLDFASSSTRVTNLIVPLWARLTVTSPAARLHLDVLGGLSWLHGVASYAYTSSQNGLIYYNQVNSNTDDFAVGLGPQVRYSFGSRIEVRLHAPLNLRVTNKYANFVTDDFAQRLFINPQLGVHYTFGG